MRHRWLFLKLGILLLLVSSLLSGCGAEADRIEQAFNGIPATMTTYDEDGKTVDEIHGKSFNVTRDTEFDTKNADGTSNNDSKVLLISLGDETIEHVGSTMIIAEDGLNDITSKLPKQFRFENTDPGTPWLNNIHFRWEQFWGGSARTIMIRSQSGAPIKIYAGNKVEVLSTEVPSSTWFRVDGKSLWVYRADITTVSTKLLQK